MKKLILSMVLVGATTLAFGQKKVVRSAEKNFKNGDYATALSEVETALQDPETGSDPETTLLKAQIQLGMFATDSSNTMENLEVGNNSYESFMKAFEMGDGDKTSGVGKDIFEEDIPGAPENLRPNSVNKLKNVAFDKAIVQYNEEDYEMAYEFFNLAGEIDPTDTTIHYNAGFLANDLGRTEDAKRHFSTLLDIEGYNKLNAYYFMIQILSTEDKDPEAAYAMVTRAKEEYPSDKDLSTYEIQLLLQLNKMDEAMAQIKTALESDPNNTALLLRSGYLKEQAGDMEGALADYKKSVEVDPQFFEGNYYAAALLIEKAREILNELNGLSDEEWEKRSESMGKEANEYYADAVTYFESALEIKPEDTGIMEILFQIHTRLKNDAKAEEYNKKLIELLGPNWMEG
ncbi:MAG: tetratricopeptide repeat protein [Cyclobacteriaceae bacterium]|uniref:Tetratricopeptide repeat protein n=1 Tax=Algoriphagus marincola TaxID=264027 RepID=A0ABS7N107_9BACT|nr:tetratricopeptide repeat protein [Algoriphagus marincola]MBY5949989.1 tetratricopeptide repeat protein [Algoriphagus marincola]MCR9082398.1 tetratricopeptide repeat protein [Cyclobacteriaceae bacterium]